MPSTLNPQTPSKAEVENLEEAILASNQGEIGKAFRDLAKQPLGTGERRVLFLLARSEGYKTNNSTQLLQLARDLRTANDAMIQFVQKYTGELFLPKAAAKEREEVNFIDNKIILFLSQQAGKQ